MDPERSKARELLLQYLDSLATGAEVLVWPDGNRKREHKFIWPQPAGLFCQWPRQQEAVEPDPELRIEPALDPQLKAAHWPGAGKFFLTGPQAKVVARLYAAYLDGTKDVDQETLLRAAGSPAPRLERLFRGSDAWHRLVVPSPGRPGSYRLPALPEAGGDDED